MDLLQVVLLVSSSVPVTHALTDKLKKLTGCEVLEVGDEPLDHVQDVVKKKKLDWKDVAYMGEADCFLST